MDLRGFYFVVMLLLISLKGISQQGKVEYYVAMKKLAKWEQEFFEKRKFNEAVVIYQVNFDPSDEGTLDENKLRTAIRREIPDNSNFKLGILDWEGKTIRKLSVLSSKSQEFKKLQANFIRAIKIAKEERPNLKWSFYDIPMRRYFSKNQAWNRESQKLLPILKECDFISPSLYMIYPKALEKSNGVDGYIDYNLSLCFDMAKKINKPVIPFVWHRTIDHDKKTGYGLISQGDFKVYIEDITRQRSNGNRVSGVIWWNSKTLHSNLKFREQIRSFETQDLELQKGSYETLKTYADFFK
ncbi:MAG TPA: hypothetical protein VKZ57_11875 [Sphingobacterium sp.]|nr:hypothetical protein [Sphingobacterium sp.]